MKRTDLNDLDLFISLKEALENKGFTRQQLIMLRQSPNLLDSLKDKLTSKMTRVERIPQPDGSTLVIEPFFAGNCWTTTEYHVPAPAPRILRTSRRRRQRPTSPATEPVN